MNNKNTKKAFTLIEISIVILIIGILMTAIAKGTEMYTKSRIIAAQNLTIKSPVARIEDLTLWLESTRNESFDINDIRDNYKITNWYSLTPRDNKKTSFFQGDINKQPTYVKDGINNIPTLYFDGTNDYLYQDNIRVGNILSSNKATIFIVSQLDSAAAAYLYDYRKDGVNVVVTGIYYENRATFTYSNDKSYGLGGNKADKYYADKHITRYVKNGSNMQIVFNGDITNAIVSNSLPQKISENDLAHFVIGARYSKDSGYTPGFIGEMIVIKDVIDDEKIVEIEEYLSQKWKIKLSN